MNDFLVFSLAADPSLGKIDKSTISQQTHMELLIEHITNKKRIQGLEDAGSGSESGGEHGAKEDSCDITLWTGLTFDASGNITEINWTGYKIEGSLSLKWLPISVHSLRVFMNRLSQSIDWAVLPEGIQSLIFAANALFGEVTWDYLPRRLVRMFLDRNKLSGSIHLENLPETLMHLNIGYNSFTGTVCLTKLPQSLGTLYICGNRLSGTIDLTQLPAGLVTLNISENNFEGETDFSKLPDSLEHLRVEETKLSGEIWVPSGKNFHADFSNVKLHPLDEAHDSTGVEDASF